MRRNPPPALNSKNSSAFITSIQPLSKNNKASISCTFFIEANYFEGFKDLEKEKQSFPLHRHHGLKEYTMRGRFPEIGT